MFQWLMNKSAESRIYMCIKEVKWDIEGFVPNRQAIVFALASALRSKIILPIMFEMNIPSRIIDRPSDYPRDTLIFLYELLEEVRNRNDYKLQALKKNMRRFGMQFPEFAEIHQKNSRRALEVWMCTVGTGISTNRLEDVQIIWNILKKTKSHILSAIGEIIEIEKQTMKITGQTGGFFEMLDRDEWKSFCDYIPETFKNKE